MEKASVSDLKASASEYLARVKAGEEVLVTDRGRPIAKIIPLRRNESEAEVKMAQLEVAGLARVGKGRLPEDFWLAECHPERNRYLTPFLCNLVINTLPLRHFHAPDVSACPPRRRAFPQTNLP